MTKKIKAELNSQLKATAIYMFHLETWDERRDAYKQAYGMAQFAAAIDAEHLNDYERIWEYYEPILYEIMWTPGNPVLNEIICEQHESISNNIENGWVWE